MTSPYVLLAALAIWVVTWIGGYAYGEHVRGNADSIATDKAVIAAQQQAAARQKSEDQITIEAAVKEAQSQQTVETVYQTIEQKVPVYVAKSDTCRLSDGYVRLWNDGATGNATDISAAAGQSDASPSGFTAVDALNNAIANFEAANQNAEQLEALQNWVKQQEQVK